METPLTPLEFARRARRLHGRLEAAVVGLPDERWGESPHAYVVPRPGATPSEAEPIAFLRDALARFEVPRRVHFFAALPRTATGKVQTYVLRRSRSAISIP